MMIRAPDVDALIGALKTEDRAQLAAALLPPGAQRAWLQVALGRILAEPLRAPSQLVAFHIDRAENCRQLAGDLQSPAMEYIERRHALLLQLAEQEQHERRLAEAYRKLPAKYPIVFTRQAELLLAWVSAGGDLYYERNRKKRDDLYHPVPIGKVVDFLVITAGIKPGTTHHVVLKFRRLHLTPIGGQLAGAGSLTINDELISIKKKA